MRSISIEIKMLIGVVLFALFIVGAERYLLSENIVEQFTQSEKSKNNLLIDTISPVIALNISLGLDDANQEYLDLIAKQNTDLVTMELIDTRGHTLYQYSKNKKEELNKDRDKLYAYSKNILDPITNESFGTINLHFDNHNYQMILNKNKVITLKIFGITFLLLMVFIYIIKREFKYLKDLSTNVLKYDPKLNNFTLIQSNRNDEVGVIQNAIVSMVAKIHSYAILLDEVNQSLESKVQERTKELEDANKKLNELAITDPLTKLSNRRHFDQCFHDVWNLAHRKGVEIALVMCDIDHFKHINDTYGHIAGDVVLREIGEILRNSLKRSMDIVARYGGEEFVIVLYDTDVDAAKQLCTNIRENLKSRDGFVFHNVKIKSVTMSFGISSKIPTEDYSHEDLIESADLALYKAKESGRNCIIAVEE
jgi:diguanylate cyclase (GGDEF)-like protein